MRSQRVGGCQHSPPPTTTANSLVCDIPVSWPEGTREPDSHEEVYAYKTTLSGETYWELNRQRPGAVLATKNHQEGLTDPQNDSDGKIFERPGSPRCPFRIVERYLSHLNPNCSNLFQWPRTSSKKIQSRRRQHLVLRFAAGTQLARANDAQDDNTAWSRSLFNQPLSASQNYHCLEFFFCGGSTYHSSHWPQKCGEHHSILRPTNVPTVPWDVVHARQLCR